jgi:hypothetical protein
MKLQRVCRRTLLNWTHNHLPARRAHVCARRAPYFFFVVVLFFAGAFLAGGFAGMGW